MKNLKIIFLSFVFVIVFSSLLQASDDYIAGLKIYAKGDCSGCDPNFVFMANPECYIIEWDVDRNDEIKIGSDSLNAPNKWCRGLIATNRSKGDPKRGEIPRILENIFKKYGFDPLKKHTPKENINIKVEEKKPYPYYNIAKIGNHSWDRFIYDCDDPEEIVKAFYLNPDNVMCEIQTCDNPIDCKRLVFKKKSLIPSTESDSIPKIDELDEISTTEFKDFESTDLQKKGVLTRVEGRQGSDDGATLEKKYSKIASNPSDDARVTGSESKVVYPKSASAKEPVATQEKKVVREHSSEPVASNFWIYICIAISSLLTMLMVISLNKKNNRFILSEITGKINQTASDSDGIQRKTLHHGLSKLHESLKKYFEFLNKSSAENVLGLLQESNNERNRDLSKLLSNDITAIINNGMEIGFRDFSQLNEQNINRAIQPLNNQLLSFKADSAFIKGNTVTIYNLVSGLSENIISGILNQSVTDKKEIIDAIDPLMENFGILHQSLNDKVVTFAEQIFGLSNIIKSGFSETMISEIEEQFHKTKKEIIEAIPILVADFQQQIEKGFVETQSKIEEKVGGNIELANKNNDKNPVLDATERIGFDSFDLNSDTWKNGLLESYNNLKNKQDAKSQFCLFSLDMCHFNNMVSILFDHNFMSKLLKASKEKNMNNYMSILNDYSSHRISVKMLPTLVYILNNMLCSIVQDQGHPVFNIYKDISYINNIFLLASKNVGIKFHHVPPQTNFLACRDYMERSPKASILIHQIIRSEEKYIDIFREWTESLKPLNSDQDIVIDVVNLGYNIEGQEGAGEKTIVTTYHDIEGKF